jgi:hypothetical protein
VRDLTGELARTNDQLGRVTWLTGGPFDLLRRGSSGESTAEADSEPRPKV